MYLKLEQIHRYVQAGGAARLAAASHGAPGWRPSDCSRELSHTYA